MPPFEPQLPSAYLITFTAKGSWLHGDPRQSTDRNHNTFGTPFVERNRYRERFEVGLVGDAVTFNRDQRRMIDRTIREVCGHRGWDLRALNVRTQHLHMVASGPVKPELIMNSLKSWCTRRLVEAGV